MKLRNSEWIALLLTAAFLMLVLGWRTGVHSRTPELTVITQQQMTGEKP